MIYKVYGTPFSVAGNAICIAHINLCPQYISSSIVADELIKHNLLTYSLRRMVGLESSNYATRSYVVKLLQNNKWLPKYRIVPLDVVVCFSGSPKIKISYV